MATHSSKSRVWWSSILVAIISLWMGTVLVLREVAFVKVELRDYFMLPSAGTDQAIEMLQNRRLTGCFILYSVALMAATPPLLHFLRRLWLPLAIIAILFVPGCWYGRQIVYVGGKMVDPEVMLRLLDPEPPPDRGVDWN